MDTQTFEIQGRTFELARQTRANIDRVQEIIQDNAAKRQEMIEWFDEQTEEVENPSDLDSDEMEARAEEELGYSEVMGEFEIRYEIFKAATVGPHEDIDVEEITWPVLEEVRTSFLPPQMRLLREPTTS